MSNLLNGFMHRPFEDNKYFGYKEDDAFEKKRHFCVGSAVSHRIAKADTREMLFALGFLCTEPDSVGKTNQFKANNKTMS